MASLQVLDPTDVKHNYANKDIIGHTNRTADDDNYFTGLYDKSVFDQLEEGDDDTPEPSPEPQSEVINTLDYDTVEDAIAAVPEGGTLQLGDDTTLPSSLVIDKNMTIDLNGNTIG